MSRACRARVRGSLPTDAAHARDPTGAGDSDTHPCETANKHTHARRPSQHTRARARACACLPAAFGACVRGPTDSRPSPEPVDERDGDRAREFSRAKFSFSRAIQPCPLRERTVPECAGGGEFPATTRACADGAEYIKNNICLTPEDPHPRHTGNAVGGKQRDLRGVAKETA